MSNLLVQNIKHTNNTTAQTIDTSGRTTVSIMNNDTTYRSDGGAVTQNLVQGLAKAWATKIQDGTSLLDSFNVSSIDDDGTGDYGLNFTNAFNNVNYVPNQNVRSQIAAANSHGRSSGVETCNTTSAECQNWYGGAFSNATFYDWETRHTFFGDLA
mgnify:FL=1|tara:strand:+ start:384 stop:851 length:468 start_codon:yes stop_codon:yes gene_type:complete